jgi:glutathione S-transferase
MDGHLAERTFLAADHVTVADLACYSYVAHAPDGGVSLEPYPNVRAWLARIEASPGSSRCRTSSRRGGVRWMGRSTPAS